MARHSESLSPDWVVAPGEILAEALAERDMTQSELAARMARPLKTVNEIINAKAAITPQTALQLERTLGISAEFWNGLESNYRTDLARKELRSQLESSKGWATAFPIRDMVKYKLISNSTDKAEQVASLLDYFRVGSPEAFDRYWTGHAAAFRASPTFEASPKATAAWLRWGEIEVEGIETPNFDESRLQAILADLRRQSRAPFARGLSHSRALLNESGVALILVPELAGTRLNGASWWRGNRAVVQLSLRHKSDDQFWFTLFHELAHLLTDKHKNFVDGAELQVRSRAEQEADKFARDCLISPVVWQEFIEHQSFDSKTVQDFAKSEEIAPGIVVGRLQREGLVLRSHLNDLKRRMVFP